MFGQRELVQEVAGNRARGRVGGGGRVGHVELVDGGGVVVVGLVPGVLVGFHVPVGGHVEVFVAGVHGLAIGQDAHARRNTQGGAQVHGEDREG